MLTDEMKQEIQIHIDHTGRREAACIEAMTIVQRKLGWLSDETICEIAEFLHMTPAEVDSVATFYNQIFRKPVGKHVILVCNSVCCWMMGVDRILEHLRDRLGIDLGQTTGDGLFTLTSVQCLGACDHAPAMMIDDDTHTDLDPETIDQILARYT